MRPFAIRVGPSEEEPEREFEVYGPVLALASPVFKSMLSCDMAESRDHLIALPGKSPTEFEAVMKFITPIESRTAKVSPENVHFLLQWADEYCMDWLKVECELELLKHPVTSQQLLLADKFTLSNLRSKCIMQLVKEPCRDTEWIDSMDKLNLIRDVFKATWSELFSLAKVMKIVRMSSSSQARELPVGDLDELLSDGTYFKDVSDPNQVQCGATVLWKDKKSAQLWLTTVTAGPDNDGDIRVITQTAGKSEWLGCSKDSSRRHGHELFVFTWPADVGLEAREEGRAVAGAANRE